MNTIKSVEQVWALVDSGKKVYWGNEAYMVFVETVCEQHAVQRNHFTRRGDKLLSIRCIENYFGSIMGIDELGSLFVKENS